MINNLLNKIRLFIFILKIKENLKNISQNINIDSNKKKITILFEFYFTDLIMISFFLIIGLVNREKYKIQFFYYSKNWYKRTGLKFFFKLFKTYIKKYLNIETINTYAKYSKNTDLSEKFFKKLRSKEDVYNITYKGQRIGKYIYQSYCRDYEKFTVDISDKKLLIKIEDALNVYDTVNNFFQKNKTCSIVMSHTVFIKYGILATIAKKLNLPIYILWRQKNNILKRIQISKNLVQSDDYKNFKKIFNNQKDKKDLISLSKKMLKRRISGMPEKLLRKNNLSSFDTKKLLKMKPSKKSRILILPGCFFDAIMFFETSLFPDNYTWLKYLLTKSLETDFEWYVKPHPDGMKGNEKVYARLKKEFPHVNIIDKDVSNLTFKHNNFSSMFTYQSNAILEFTYMNIPTVIISDNLQSSFNYAKPILNLKEFDKMILNADKLKLKKNAENEIHQFNSVLYNFRSSKVKFFSDFFIQQEKHRNFSNQMNEINKYFDKNFFKEHKKSIEKILL